MKLIDFLKMAEDLPYLIIYEEDDGENPLWEGRAFNVPWWIADLELSNSDPYSPPISFRSSLGEDYDNKPGFVIIVKG